MLALIVVLRLDRQIGQELREGADSRQVVQLARPVAAQHLPEQLFLPAEIPADQSDIDAGAAGNVAQADAFVAVGEKVAAGRAQDGLAGGGRIALAGRFGGGTLKGTSLAIMVKSTSVDIYVYGC